MARRGHWAFTASELERSVMYAEATFPDNVMTFDDFVSTTLTGAHLSREILISVAFRHLDADNSGDISPHDMCMVRSFKLYHSLYYSVL